MLFALVVSVGFVSPVFSQDIRTVKVYTAQPVEGGVQLQVGAGVYGPYAGLEGTPWFSADGRSWGMVLRKPDGQVGVLVNGQEKAFGKDYNSLMDVSLSPDGAHWSVRADQRSGQPTRNLRIVDGNSYGAYDMVADIEWSPTSASWYFTARTGSSLFVVQDGKRYGPMQAITDVAWDAAGRRLCLVESRTGGTWVRVNEREYGPFDRAQIVRTGDGTFLGFLTTLRNGNRELTIADKKYGPYSYVDWGREYISADGTDWLVMVVRGSRAILLQNGKETELGRLAVYKLAKGWLYTWEQGEQEFVVFNGTQYGPYMTGRNLAVTGDGSTWAMSHKRYDQNRESSFVAVNGKDYSGTGFSHVITATEDYFSWVSGGVDSDALYSRCDGGLVTQRLYAVSTPAAGITVEAGGKTSGPYQQTATSPSASPDGAHWGLVARTADNKYMVLVDGKESGPYGPYDQVRDFNLSDAGTGWGFTAVPDAKEPGRLLKVVNGQEYGPYSWMDRVWFSRDGKGFYFWSSLPGKGGGGVLTFNGKGYGPFQDFAYRFFDLEAGVFALVSQSSAGASIRVGDETFGSYQSVDILRVGVQPETENGRYFGFVATLKDGRREIHIQGDKVYGPYKEVRLAGAWPSETGVDWLFTVRKSGSSSDTLLYNGVEQETQGFDIRPWAGSWLMFLRKDNKEGFAWRDGSAGPWSKVQSWWITLDGKTWVAQVYAGDGPGQTSLVVVNGKEYPGDRLRYVNSSAEEYFTWVTRGDDGVGTVSVLKVR
jgi:hypothetical protein